MPVRVLCRNPNCSASYSAIDAGPLENCPSCGWKLHPVGETYAGGTPETRANDDFILPEAVPMPDPLVGATFAERYRITKRIAKGGMGAVYLAHDTMLERDVALKIPLVDADEGSEYLKRFVREARSAAKLHHPNICPVYDVGSHSGQPFLTMAYIDGVSLADHLKERKTPFDPVKAARLVRTLALALQKAHEAGVIHRDLKPGNIMISKEGRPTIMDFGLARRDDVNESLKTRTGQIMGTPAYMPIEQFRGDVHAMGPRSDVYSLGVILFQLLTGRLPFEGAPMSLMAQLLQSETPSASTLRADLNPELVAVCRKAMGKEIDDRFATMKEFAAAIDAYLSTPAATPTNDSPAVSEGRGQPESAESPRAENEADFPTGGGEINPALVAIAASDRFSLEAGRAPAAIANRLREHWYWVAPAIFAAVTLLGLMIYIATKPARVDSRKPAPTDSTKAAPAVSGKSEGAPVVFVGAKAGDAKTLRFSELDLNFRWCPPGKFTMGSPKSEKGRYDDEDPVEVVITKGFWMLQTEVTQELFERVTRANPSNFDSPRNPVETVAYGDAAGFTTKLTEKLQEANALPSDWRIKLPTEAQWEYACRAGTQTAFAFGDSLSGTQANFNGNFPYGSAKKGPDLRRPAAVGQYAANAWGLRDMHGNVWEWCLDGYRDRSPGGVDPFTRIDGAPYLVIRGGSWNNSAMLARSAYRSRSVPDNRNDGLGFRVVAVEDK